MLLVRFGRFTASLRELEFKCRMKKIGKHEIKYYSIVVLAPAQ